MRNREYAKKCLALMLSVSMAVQPGCIALAEETEVQSIETEIPQAEAPEAEVSKEEAPQAETPATEAPVTEAPVTEAPVTEAPVTEAPETEAPVTEALETEAPVTEAPETEAPVTEAPETEAPVTEAPVTEAPVTEAPATEVPETESSETEVPKPQATDIGVPVIGEETQYTVKYQVYTWNEAQKRNTKIVSKTMKSNGANATISMPDVSTIPDVMVNGVKYVFKGWRVGRVGENNEIQTEMQFPAGDDVTTDVSELGSKYLMIYATYEVQSATYTLSYDGNGANVTSVPEAQKETTATGVAVFNVTDAKPVRTGYIFKGWAETEDATEAKYAAGDEIRVAVKDENQSRTLYAVWESTMVGPQEDTEINVYLEYMDSSLEGGYRVEESSRKTVTVTCQNQSEHSKYTSHQVKYKDVAAAADAASYAVEEGWEIVGIARNAGTNQSVFALDTFMTGGVQSPYNSFYLVAKKNYTYTLSYDGNGANVTSVPEAQKETTATGVAVFNVTDAKPVRTGYIFKGWAETEDATEAKYAAGDEIRVAVKDENQSRTLYAVWEKEASSITLNKEALTLEFGSKEALIADLKNVEETIWTSSDPSVVTVAADGTVTAVGLGTAVVTCTDKADENVKAACEVTVKDSTVLKAQLTVISGTSARVTWNKVPSASGYQIYRMQVGSGSYQLVKTVSAATTTWRNDGLAAGKTYRYYVQAYRTAAGKKVTTKKSSVVSGVMPKITLSASKLTLQYGKTATLKATKTGVTAVKWISSNPKIVKVSANGALTTTGIGTATITCVSQKNQTVKASCTVTVKENTMLRLQAVAGKGNNKLSWTKIPSASGYMVYGTLCGGNFKLLKTVSAASTSWTHSGLSAGKSYRYYVKAYRVVNGEKITLKTSNDVHSAVPGGKYTNVKSISVNTKAMTLNVGKTKKIVGKVVLTNTKGILLKHTAELLYTTSNKNVATVSKDGVVTAVGKGSCIIYVRAGNGVSTTVTVTVK